MDNKNTEYFNFNNNDIDLGKLFRLILMQSKIVLLITFIGTSLAMYQYLSLDRIYKVTSLLQILPKEQNINNIQGLGNFNLGSSYTSDIESIQQLYRSRSNIMAITKNMNLNINVEDLSEGELSFISIFSVKKFEDLYVKDFVINLGENSYEILDKDYVSIGNSAYGEVIENNLITAQIMSPPIYLKNTSQNLRVTKADVLYPEILSRFSIQSKTSSFNNPFYNGAALVEISYSTKDIDNGIKVLNYSNNFFISDSIEIESEQAKKALNFINLRADEVENQLERQKTSLAKFKEKNKTVDVDLEIQSILRSLEEIEAKISEIDIEIEKAKNNYTLTNPIFISLLNQQRTLIDQKTKIESKIENLPVSQQQFIDLFRELELTQNVFNELQSRQLEFSIREASTLGNMRVVDSAYFAQKVSPRLLMVPLVFMLSLIIGIFVAVIRGLLFLPISNPAELEDSGINIPILGVINKTDDKDEEQTSERFNQAIESMIVNIQNKLHEKVNNSQGKVILFSSPTAENGKSFVSRETAIQLSKLGNKVLLLDADFKRGDQHIFFDVSKIRSRDFFDLNHNNINKYKINDELYFIARPSKLSSSFEFLYDPRFKEKIDFFKDYFDYIIIDTAPILSVSDTLILISYSDSRLCVCRHGLNKINDVKQAVTLFTQVGEMPDGIIYNCYERPSGYYGYYGMYGNYSYQYYAKRYLYESYDYKQNEN